MAISDRLLNFKNSQFHRNQICSNRRRGACCTLSMWVISRIPTYILLSLRQITNLFLLLLSKCLHKIPIKIQRCRFCFMKFSYVQLLSCTREENLYRRHLKLSYPDFPMLRQTNLMQIYTIGKCFANMLWKTFQALQVNCKKLNTFRKKTLFVCK